LEIKVKWSDVCQTIRSSYLLSQK